MAKGQVNSKLSDKRAATRKLQASGGYREPSSPEHLRRFINTGNPEIREACIQQQESISTDVSFLQAGRMALEMAHQQHRADDALRYLNRAERNWQNAAAFRKLGYTETVGRANLHLACMPAYYWYALERKVPPAHITQDIYQKSLAVAVDHQKAFEQEPSQPIRSGLVGTMGELVVASFLRRFGLETGNDDWLVMPASLSDDAATPRRGGLFGDVIRSSWDVGVLTQYDSDIPPVLTYAAQIKAGKNFKRYRPDIPVIQIDKDLSLPQQDGSFLPAHLIMQECIEDMTTAPADPQAVQRIEARTDKLLTILG